MKHLWNAAIETMNRCDKQLLFNNMAPQDLTMSNEPLPDLDYTDIQQVREAAHNAYNNKNADLGREIWKKHAEAKKAAVTSNAIAERTTLAGNVTSYAPVPRPQILNDELRDSLDSAGIIPSDTDTLLGSREMKTSDLQTIIDSIPQGKILVGKDYKIPNNQKSQYVKSNRYTEEDLKNVQRIVGASIDGKIGPKSISRIEARLHDRNTGAPDPILKPEPVSIGETPNNLTFAQSSKQALGGESRFFAAHENMQSLNQKMGYGMKAVEKAIDGSGIVDVPQEYREIFGIEQESAFKEHLNTAVPKIQEAINSLFQGRREKGVKTVASKLAVNAAQNAVLGIATSPLLVLSIADIRIGMMKTVQDSPVTIDQLSRLYTWIAQESPGTFDKNSSGYSYNEAFKDTAQSFYDEYQQGVFENDTIKRRGIEELTETIDSYIDGPFQHDKQKIQQASFGGSGFKRWWNRNASIHGNSQSFIAKKQELNTKFQKEEAILIDDNQDIHTRIQAMEAIKKIAIEFENINHRKAGEIVGAIDDDGYVTIDGKDVLASSLGTEYIVDEDHMGLVYKAKDRTLDDMTKLKNPATAVERGIIYSKEFQKQIKILAEDSELIAGLFTEVVTEEEQKMNMKAFKEFLLEQNNLEAIEQSFPATKEVEKLIQAGKKDDTKVKEWLKKVRNSTLYEKYFQNKVLKEEAALRGEKLNSIEVGRYKHATPLDPNHGTQWNLNMLKTSSPDKGNNSSYDLIRRSLSENIQEFPGLYIDEAEFDNLFLKGAFVDINQLEGAENVLNMSRGLRDSHDTLTTAQELRDVRGDECVFKITRSLPGGVTYDIFFRLECGGNPLRTKPIVTINTRETNRQWITQNIPDLPDNFSIDKIPRIAVTVGMLKEDTPKNNDQTGGTSGTQKDLSNHDDFSGPTGGKGDVGGNGSWGSNGGSEGWVSTDGATGSSGWGATN